MNTDKIVDDDADYKHTIFVSDSKHSKSPRVGRMTANDVSQTRFASLRLGKKDSPGPVDACVSSLDREVSIVPYINTCVHSANLGLIFYLFTLFTV